MVLGLFFKRDLLKYSFFVLFNKAMLDEEMVKLETLMRSLLNWAIKAPRDSSFFYCILYKLTAIFLGLRLKVKWRWTHEQSL